MGVSSFHLVCFQAFSPLRVCAILFTKWQNMEGVMYMKALRKGIVLFLCLALSIGFGSAMASEEGSADGSELGTEYERLLRFAVVVKPWEEDGWDDEPIFDISDFYLHITAETFEEEKLDAAEDRYASIESLTLSGFSQSQFAEIVTQTPNLRSLSFWDCDIDDFSPLLPLASQLKLDFSWTPDLLERLEVLPTLYRLELRSIPDADLSRLAALTGLEVLRLQFESDSTVDISALGTLENLRSLELQCYGSPFDSLPEMAALEELKLYCDIDGAQLEHTLALQKLYLHQYIPDDLTALYSLPDLDYLEINAVHTDFMKYVEELEALHEAMPNLKIVLYYCC